MYLGSHSEQQERVKEKRWLTFDSKSPAFVPGWLPFFTAWVSAPVYHETDRKVFDQSMFSTAKEETAGGSLLRETDEPERSEGIGLFEVNVLTDEYPW